MRVNRSSEQGRRGGLAATKEAFVGSSMSLSKRGIYALVAVVAVLVGMFPILPAQAASVTSITFSGGAAGTTGSRYAKTGTSLTVTVNTSSDTRCVTLAGPGATGPRQTSNPKSSWTFTVTAPSGEGAKTLTATATPNFNNNNCTGQEGTATATYTVDNSGPTVTSAVNPAPNAAGWNKGDVGISWSATDSGVGIQTACPSATPNPNPCTDSVSANTAGTTKTSTAKDRLGNSNEGSVTVKLDKTAPTITGSRSPAPNANGWNNTDIVVEFDCDDVLSGIKSCLGSRTVSTNGAGQSADGTTTDIADNSASDTVPNINIDKVAPSLSGAPTTSPNDAGWYNSNVTVAWTCSDALSGIAGSCPAHGTISNEGMGLTANGSVSDLAGNQTNTSSSAVKIDKSAPNTMASGNTNWTNGNVTLALSATDNLSNVKSTSYRVNGGAVTAGSSVALSTEGVHTVEYWSEDNAGNTEVAKSVQVKIDRTAPSITPTFSTEALRGWFKANVTVGFVCADPEPTPDPQGTVTNASGIASCTTPVEVTTEGRNQNVPGTAVDRAGNSSSSSASASIDMTPPTISAAADRAPNAAGWYNDDVTISYTFADALSGVFGSPTNDVIGEGSAGSASGVVEDNAGNAAEASVTGIKVDKTAPTLTGGATTAPNGNGWYSGDVTVAWTCGDELSGVAGACPANSTITGEGANLRTSESVQDRAGNSKHTTVDGINIDRHAPATTASLPAPLGTGWYEGDVLVTLAGIDPLSDVAATYYKVNDGATQTYSGPFSFSRRGTSTITFWSVDNAGNVEDSTGDSNSVSVKIDDNKPTITANVSPAANGNGWRKEPVTVTFNCDDAESGVETCSSPATLTEDGADQEATGYATDGAGNSEELTVDGIDIDTTAPETQVTVTGPERNGWYTGPVEVSFSANATELSGIDDTYYTFGDIADAVLYEGSLSVTASSTLTFWSIDNAGNTEAVGEDNVLTIDIDDENPTIQGGRTPAANADGWNNGSVNVSFACNDGRSGIASCEADHLLDDEGQGQSVQGTARDHAGNESTDTVSDINIDLTPPSLTGEATTEPSNGWYNDDVTIDWTCGDDLSGIAAGACPTDSTVVGEGTDLKASSSVSDRAGNLTRADSETVNIDGTAPITSAQGTGWTKESYTVTFEATDALSGAAATYYKVNAGSFTSGDSVTLEDDGSYNVSFYSVDNAGNEETTRSVTVEIDKTAPTIGHELSPEPNGAGWNRSDVTVSFQCGDTGSGLAISGCTADQQVTTEGAGQQVQGTATDKAGNSATSTAAVNLDETAPSIIAAADREPDFVDPFGLNSWYRDDVTVTFTCDDGLSGIAHCSDEQTLHEGRNPSAAGTARDAAGNEAGTTLGPINIDETPPTVTGEPTTAATNGWYQGDVTIEWTCSDALSGLAATCADSTISSEGTEGSASRSVEDVAGNEGNGSVTDIKIDKTDPVVEITDAPSGYLTTDGADIGFTATDNLTEAAELTVECKLDTGAWAECSSPEQLTELSEGAHEITVRATDLSGRTDSASASFTVDTVAPETTIDSATPSGNVITVNFSSEEGASFECALDDAEWTPCASGQQYADLDDDSYTVNVRATDAAGNTDDTPASRTVVVDTTGPADASLEIDGGADWTTDEDGAVALSVGATDARGITTYRLASSQSSLATATKVVLEATQDLSLQDVPFTLTGDEGSKDVWVSVCDAKDNCTEARDSIGWDKTAPTVTVDAPGTGAVSVASTSTGAPRYVVGEKVSAKYLCKDSGSSVKSCVGSVENDAALDTATVGSKTFTVTGSDEAGNETVVNVGYRVDFRFNGFLQPINDTRNGQAQSKFKAGSTIPVKFQLQNNAGSNLQQTGVPSFSYSKTSTGCDSSTQLEAVETAGSTTGSSFRWDATTQQYQYNFSTKGLTAGEYTIVASGLEDGRTARQAICITR